MNLTFAFLPTALSEWHKLPPDAGIVILTVSKRGEVPVILAVTFPNNQSRPFPSVRSVSDDRQLK